MTRPPTIYDVELAKDGENVHTFSNGTQLEYWAGGNCWSCRFYDLDGAAGALCAFEGAALMGAVTPDLARLFGWVQRTTEHGPRFGWDAPETCRFWRDKTDDNGETVDPTQPDICPETLSLFADQRTTADMPVPASVNKTHRAKKGTP